MTEITSLQHPIVKHFVKLRKSRSYRRECGTTVIVGKKLIQELSRHVPLKTLLTEPGVPPLRAEKHFLVTPGIVKKITGLQEPEPYAAEVALPKPGNLAQKNFLLVLDGISDPGNLGTLLRTALALGWEGVFLTNGSADPFNEKALRAAKGATFHLPILEGSHEELAALIEKNRAAVYLADMRGKDVQTLTCKPPLMLILGSEAHGVAFTHTKATALSIPMQKEAESLNVAIAGGILMYALRRSS